MVEVIFDLDALRDSGESPALILMAISKLAAKMRDRPKVKATGKNQEPIEISGNYLGVAWKAVDKNTIEVVNVRRLQKPKGR